MDFHLSKEHEMIRKMYREFAENEVKPLAEEVDETEEFPVETVKKLGKLGMMGIYFPKKYGGAGGDVLSEQLGGGPVGGTPLVGVAGLLHELPGTGVDLHHAGKVL